MIPAARAAGIVCECGAIMSPVYGLHPVDGEVWWLWWKCADEGHVTHAVPLAGGLPSEATAKI